MRGKLVLEPLSFASTERQESADIVRKLEHPRFISARELHQMCYGVPGMRKSQSTALAITKQACAQVVCYRTNLQFILNCTVMCN